MLQDKENIKLKVMEKIVKNLSLSKASMFIRENLYQKVDYSEIKDRLFGKLTVDELYKEITGLRKKGGLKMESLIEMIKKLPPEYEQEVYDFVQFLLEKKYPKPKKELKLSWRGALQNLKDKYTSVELQHKILELWSD